MNKMKDTKFLSSSKLSKASTNLLSCNDIGTRNNTTMSRSSQFLMKVSTTDFKTITSESECGKSILTNLIKRTNTLRESDRKITNAISFLNPEQGKTSSKFLEKFNEIFNKKKMIFNINKPPRKRIYRTKDGKCYNLNDEVKLGNRHMCARSQFEINTIKNKINFMKCVCDYSYPRIISKQITLLKKNKSVMKNLYSTNRISHVNKNSYENLNTEETVRSGDINKTCSYFYALETDPIYMHTENIFPKINNK
jgi:hypothetical protein